MFAWVVGSDVILAGVSCACVSIISWGHATHKPCGVGYYLWLELVLRVSANVALALFELQAVTFFPYDSRAFTHYPDGGRAVAGISRLATRRVNIDSSIKHYGL